uniref:Uncharacterized protein n=1 Tax=Timema cristinae TaxID=61476 RepID=A0A7R9D5U1_TIMCR|nr:unnamed protein product [Timema cristinae]
MYSSPVASLVLTDSSQPTYDSQHLGTAHDGERSLIQKCPYKRKCTHLCVEGEWKTVKENHPQYARPRFEPRRHRQRFKSTARVAR